jgi:AAA domain
VHAAWLSAGTATAGAARAALAATTSVQDGVAGRAGGASPVSGIFWDPPDHADLAQPGQVRPFPTVDLAALARKGVEAPELLCDGLLYRRGLHSLAGPPESGKSTIAYWWTLQLLAQGLPVMLLDEEAGREQVLDQLLALGATEDHLEHLAYVEFPGRRWDAADRAGLAELLEDHAPALVVVDAAAAFLAVAGQDEDRAGDVTRFYKGVLLQAARSGPAVVVLDHVPKDHRNGRYARGSGGKLAAVDVAYMVEAVLPFTRQQSGRLSLVVAKDRRGYLHRAFDVDVEVEPGVLALRMHRATAASDPALVGLAPSGRKVLVVLRAAAGQQLTIAQIGDAVADTFGHGLRRPTLSEQLQRLSARHLVDGEQGDGKQKRWWAL